MAVVVRDELVCLTNASNNERWKKQVEKTFLGQKVIGLIQSSDSIEGRAGCK